MNRFLGVFAGMLALASASAAAAAPTGRLLVTLERAPGQRAASAAAVRASAAIARTGAVRSGPAVAQIGLVTVRPRAGVPAAALARVLRSVPGVARVDIEHRATLRYSPNDPAFSALETAAGAPAGTTVEWWATREGFPAAWDVARGGGATVALIDTGIDASHPEFAGRVKEVADFDDTVGDGPATVDEAGHGTHVASLACAVGDNAVGLAGGGFGCAILVIKTDLSDGSVAQSIVWAVDHGADAINMSFGTDGSHQAAGAVVDAIDYAYLHGVVMAAAAADDPVEEQGDPANVLQPTGTGPDIALGKGLSVTAANFSDQRASFAGHGSQISIAAYGAFQQPNGPKGLFGAFPAGATQLESGSAGPPSQAPCNCRTTFNGDNRYAYLQGTSMAAPMVAAAAALVRHLNPDLSAADIIRILKETARRPSGGWTPDLGWGILDAGAAVGRAASIDRRPPTSRLRSRPRVRGQRVTLRWSGHDPAPPGVLASGIAHFELWRSANGRGARRVLVTNAHNASVKVRRGSRYSFFTIAVDVAGNREPVPLRPDVRVRVRRSRG